MSVENLQVPVESLRPIWEELISWAQGRFRSQSWGNQGSVFGRFDAQGFCKWADIERSSYNRLQSVMSGQEGSIGYRIVERLLIGCKREHLLHSLYVVDLRRDVS